MKICGVHCILYQVLEGRDGDRTIGLILQKRNHIARIYPGYWACFGGSIDGKESYEECVKRELEEECTRIKIKFSDKKYEIPIRRGDNELSMLFLVAELKQGNFGVRGEESLGCAVFNPEEIHHLQLRPEDRMAIGKFLGEGV